MEVDAQEKEILWECVQVKRAHDALERSLGEVGGFLMQLGNRLKEDPQGVLFEGQEAAGDEEHTWRAIGPLEVIQVDYLGSRTEQLRRLRARLAQLEERLRIMGISVQLVR